jgi:LacI family transcriptional regulator
MVKKIPTIKEIAKRLNVSVSTVSRALHDHHSIGLRTKMQVQKLARELNYEPNQAAIFFKKGKTFTIGVILPNLQEQFFSIAINGVELVASAHQYNVLISQSHDSMEREKKIVEMMRRSRVDGIIVSVSKNTTTFDHFLQLKEYNIPVVFFDRAPAMEGAISVTCSLKQSTIHLVDLLVAKGHKRIALINGPGSITLSAERALGYQEGLKKYKLAAGKELYVQTDLSVSSTEKAMGKLLALKNPPTAVIVFNDYVALDAMRYTRRQGFKINQDIFFVSYANLPITHYLDNPPFASVEQFPMEQAEKATEILLSLINKKTQEQNSLQCSIVLEGKVILYGE